MGDIGVEPHKLDPSLSLYLLIAQLAQDLERNFAVNSATSPGYKSSVKAVASQKKISAISSGMGLYCVILFLATEH